MYSWGYIKDATLNKLDLDETEADQMNLLSRFIYYANEAITQISSAIKPNRTFAKFEVTENEIGKELKMPDDFISFGHDTNRVIVQTWPCNDFEYRVANSECFEYLGYNHIVPKIKGTFYISYNARWITFEVKMNSGDILDVPADILDCLPSYIASQCMMIDDEGKAATLRNEYEMLLARIDDTDYSNDGEIFLKGDW